MKLIAHTTINNRTAKLYRDAVNQEYVVKLYVNNKLNKDATYYTDDRADALSTAKAMIKPVAANAN